MNRFGFLINAPMKFHTPLDKPLEDSQLNIHSSRIPIKGKTFFIIEKLLDCDIYDCVLLRIHEN